MTPIRNARVAAVFAAYPAGMRRKLLRLRELILSTALAEGAGELEETLKWGEPAYLTTQSGSGSTVRLGWKKSAPAQYAIFFHCQTNLVDTLRTLFPHDFRYEGNRAIVFEARDRVPVKELRFCIGMALTYHRARKAGRAARPR